MTYPRPAYRDESIRTQKARIPFSNDVVEIPRLETPITPLENFKRAAARANPIWAPNGLSDFQTMMFQQLGDGPQIGVDYLRDPSEDYTFTDWFGVPLTWVASAGGATNTPGTCVLEDITDWERVIRFPNLSDWDWKTKADAFMKNEYDPDKVLHIDLHNGCMQRLIAVLGGYTEGMYALALEPEAVRDFFERLADHMIELVDLICDLYPVDMMTIHDDWGTEKDTFFSPDMMEKILYGPTKRIVDRIRARGAVYMQHSCGNVTRFIPYMIDMGASFLQLQRRAVDLPAMKALYGDRVGFNVGIEGLEPGRAYSKEERAEMIRRTVDIYGAGGGFYANIYERDPEVVWDAICELYACSREYYDGQFGR